MNDAYQKTVDRLEPDVTPVDADPARASIAISLKRIADVLEWMKAKIESEEKK